MTCALAVFARGRAEAGAAHGTLFEKRLRDRRFAMEAMEDR